MNASDNLNISSSANKPVSQEISDRWTQAKLNASDKVEETKNKVNDSSKPKHHSKKKTEHKSEHKTEVWKEKSKNAGHGQHTEIQKTTFSQT